MDPNKEIDDLEEMEESEGPEEETNDEEFEPELDSDSDEKNDIEDNDLDEEEGDNEVIVDTDDDASIYDDDASDDDVGNDVDDEDTLEDSIKENKKTKPKTNKQNIQLNTEYNSDDSDEEDDDDDDENYLQKFSREINKQYIEKEHPECIFHNYNEISALSKVIRDKNNNIIDPLHRTVPFLTKYEKTRIIGQRAKQINSGAKPFVNVPQHIIDGYIIAELELKQKKIPFIIKRPIPGGGSEYWNVKDLELI
jgi:DNA-directed RNA polymerase I, II, and III subunit RPABC2